MLRAKNWSFQVVSARTFGVITLGIAVCLLFLINNLYRDSENNKVVSIVLDVENPTKNSSSLPLALVRSFTAENTDQFLVTDKNMTFQHEMRRCSQEERMAYIDSQCQRKNVPEMDRIHKSKWDKTPIFIVDEEHKVAYCTIPKTGSSTLKTLMMISSKIGRQIEWPRYSHQDKDLLQRGLKLVKYTKKLDKYTKFMVVRNPYARIVSAYKEKLVPKNHSIKYFRDMKQYILKMLGKHKWEQLSFVEFIRFIQSDKGEGLRGNTHWDSYTQVCKPCDISYDFIFRTETYSEDLDMILPFLNQTKTILQKATRNVGETKEELQKLGQTEHKIGDFKMKMDFIDDLSEEQVTRLKRFYRNEDVMFGYGLDDQRISYCSMTTESGQKCC